MSNRATNAYRERLKQRQRQEYEDKGKTGLGKKSVLNLSRKGIGEIRHFIPRYLPEKNEIDILPFEITQAWYTKLRMPSGRSIGLEMGDWDYKLQVPVHRGIGAAKDTYLCLREAFGGACAICDDMFDAYRAGDKKKAADLRPSWRCFYNIFDYEDQDKGIQLFEIPYRSFEATSKNDPQRANLIDAMNLDPSGLVLFYDLEEGKTIVASFKKKVLGKQEFPEITEISFVDRDPYEEDIFQRVYPLDAMLVIPKPEEVKQAHYSIDDDDDGHSQSQDTSGEQDKDQEEEQAPVSTSRGRSRAFAEPKKEEAVPPKKEEAPVAGRRGRTSVPVKEDVPVCPAGGVFGKDCNKLKECEGNAKTSCDEKVFEACSAAFVTFQKEEDEKEAAEKEAAEKEAAEKEAKEKAEKEKVPSARTSGAAAGSGRKGRSRG